MTLLWTLWKLAKRAGGIKGKWKLVLERVESRFHAPLSLMVAVCSEIMPPWKRHTEVADKAKEVTSWGGVLTHCLDLDLNGLLTRHNFWRISGMLGNYTIPKWKEFLKSCKPILRKSYLSTFNHVNKHMDGARDIFWIKSLNGTFLVLQIKAFGPKNFQISCRG